MSLYTLYCSSSKQETDCLSDLHASVCDVSVILPTYNEEANILKLINQIVEQLKDRSYQIIVVDDSSKDKTQEIVKNASYVGLPVYLLARKKKGVFSAQKDGAYIAGGKVIVFLDSDFSHPPEKIPELLARLPKYDLANGSRFLPGSKIIAPFSRKYSTKVLNFFLRVWLGWEVTDYTGIFMAVKKEVWSQLNLKYESVWGECGMEIFKEVRRLNFAIIEVPFIYDYRKEGQSKSDSLLKYAWVYFRMAVRVKFKK